MIHINDSSRFVSPHYDRELIFFILKDFIRKSDSHDSLKVFIKYVNMENRKDFVMKNSVDNFSKIINMRYFSQNLVFEKCIPTLFSNKIDKEITNSFLSQYLGEIRRNNKDGFYIEDIFNFLYSYNANCSVDSDIYLDSLQLIKDKVIHGNLKSNTEFRLVEFIDLCISYCNSKQYTSL